MDSIDNWSYNEFLTFILIMGAKADLSLSEIEKEYIVQHVGEEDFKKVFRVYERQNDSQHIDTVSELYEKYESQIGGKENLLKELKSVIKADHHAEHAMDQYLMMMMKRIL